VLTKTFEVIVKIAEAAPQFPKRGVVLCMPGMRFTGEKGSRCSRASESLVAPKQAVLVSILSSGLYEEIEKDDDQFGACYVLPFMAC
jgi:hypothetical protein